MKKRKNVLLCLLLALSLICNLSVMSASAVTQKEKITLSNLPTYSGEAYVELNNNLPGFKKSELTKKAFEKYSDLPSCSSVDDMKEKNKKEVSCSREEIIDMGYSPCKRCNP